MLFSGMRLVSSVVLLFLNQQIMQDYNTTISGIVKIDPVQLI